MFKLDILQKDILKFELPKLDRKKSVAIGLLAALLVLCILGPIICLKIRFDALDALSDQNDLLTHLEAAHHRALGRLNAQTQFGKAPAAAFLNAQTPGLATAQLEAYLSKLVTAEQGSLVSSATQHVDRSEASELVRLQATLFMSYGSLQKFLYRLETGTPYVFVDSMMLRAPSDEAHASGLSSIVKVTLDLRALWHRKSD